VKRHGPVTTVGLAHKSGLGLWAYCRNCGHVSAIDTWRLCQKVKAYDALLRDVAKRFRCKRCLNAETVLIPARGFAHDG
jgi:transcription elongation factor Elf1